MPQSLGSKMHVRTYVVPRLRSSIVADLVASCTKRCADRLSNATRQTIRARIKWMACMMMTPRNALFVVLTYVWGGVQHLRSIRATESLLTQDGDLDAVWPMLTTTVRDAIIVCPKIGERYPLTDTLCIMQDSWQAARIPITWMRQINSSAKCAIAAVLAATAAIGLHGHLSVEHEASTIEYSLSALIESSPWSRRAGFQQEKVLSHRMIAFTSTGSICSAKGVPSHGKECSLHEDHQNRSRSTNHVVGCCLYLKARISNRLLLRSNSIPTESWAMWRIGSMR